MPIELLRKGRGDFQGRRQGNGLVPDEGERTLLEQLKKYG